MSNEDAFSRNFAWMFATRRSAVLPLNSLLVFYVATGFATEDHLIPPGSTRPIGRATCVTRHMLHPGRAVRANCTSSGQPPMAARPTPSRSTDALEQVSIKKNCGIQFRQG
jgi:hypothetical protein